jgi:hypothetical protein
VCKQGRLVAPDIIIHTIPLEQELGFGQVDPLIRIHIKNTPEGVEKEDQAKICRREDKL